MTVAKYITTNWSSMCAYLRWYYSTMNICTAQKNPTALPPMQAIKILFKNGFIQLSSKAHNDSVLPDSGPLRSEICRSLMFLKLLL